jgi:hypothetical protein
MTDGPTIDDSVFDCDSKLVGQKMPLPRVVILRAKTKVIFASSCC